MHKTHQLPQTFSSTMRGLTLACRKCQHWNWTYKNTDRAGIWIKAGPCPLRLHFIFWRPKNLSHVYAYTSHLSVGTIIHSGSYCYVTSDRLEPVVFRVWLCDVHCVTWQLLRCFQLACVCMCLIPSVLPAVFVLTAYSSDLQSLAVFQTNCLGCPRLRQVPACLEPCTDSACFPQGD